MNTELQDHPYSFDQMVKRIHRRLRLANYDKHSPRPMQERDYKFLLRWANMYSLAASIPDDNRFNMSHWAKRNKASECGTSACLAGHAALHPWFIRNGLPPLRGSGAFDSSLGFTGGNYFGLLSVYGTPNPFMPFFVAGVYDGSKRSASLKTYEAAAVVKAWMYYWWGEEKAEKALLRAKATYSAEEVHKRVPWECPI